MEKDAPFDAHQHSTTHMLMKREGNTTTVCTGTLRRTVKSINMDCDLRGNKEQQNRF